MHQDLATHDLRGSVGANAVRSSSASVQAPFTSSGRFGTSSAGSGPGNTVIPTCGRTAVRTLPSPHAGHRSQTVWPWGTWKLSTLQLRCVYSLSEDDLCTNIVATVPAADRDGGNRHVRYFKRFVLLLVIAYLARQLQLVAWQQVQHRGTDLRPSAFQAGHIQLAWIVRALCAVAGRCCQPLVAAVAVTVAVISGAGRLAVASHPHPQGWPASGPGRLRPGPYFWPECP